MSRKRKSKRFGSLPHSSMRGNALQWINVDGPRFVARVASARKALGQRPDSCLYVPLKEET